MSVIMIDEDESALEALINGSFVAEIETVQTFVAPSIDVRRSDDSVR